MRCVNEKNVGSAMEGKRNSSGKKSLKSLNIGSTVNGRPRCDQLEIRIRNPRRGSNRIHANYEQAYK